MPTSDPRSAPSSPSAAWRKLVPPSRSLTWTGPAAASVAGPHKVHWPNEQISWLRNLRPASEVVMRYAGWLHPEWGYLAPAPSFLRTVRIALVSAAIGAIGGVVVVISLDARSGSDDDKNLIAHALLTKAPAIITPVAGSVQSQISPVPRTAGTRSLGTAAVSMSITNALAKARDPRGTMSPTGTPVPVGASASAEIPSATETTLASAAPAELAPPKRSSSGKHHLVAARLRKGWHQVKHRRLFDEFGEHRFCCTWRDGSAMHDDW